MSFLAVLGLIAVCFFCFTLGMVTTAALLDDPNALETDAEYEEKEGSR